MPVREDCWSEDATSTLIDAWGSRYLELNRGNLRQKDWQEVADAVNAYHGNVKKAYRTDVQCKNRIDTVKKKYKTEKSRILSSNGTLTSNWPFYDRLDALIGSNVSDKKLSLSPSPPLALPLPYMKTPTPPPVAVVSKKRSAPVEDSYFRRNYSAVAAAAAATVEEESDAEEDDMDGSRSSAEGEGEADGIRRLARAIERFGEIYERVEGEKQRQMIELEKQRMQFAKDLEVQRMQMFMNTQVQLENIKRSKRSGSSDIYS